MPAEHLRVLLIEDDPDDALLIRLMLAEENEVSFQCEHAGDLSSGLERLGEYRADIVLLDLGLPDTTGIDTLVRMRQQASDVPIVVLTGQYDIELGIQAISNGAQDYLVKGQAGSTLLIRTLCYALERHRLQAELKEQAEALAASESRLRSIVDKNVDAIVGVGADGNLAFVSRAAEGLFGRKAEEMIGKPFGFPIATDKIVELRIEQPSGNLRFVEMDVVEVDWEGAPVHLASLRDVTERKRAEDALRRSRRDWEQIFQSIGQPSMILDQQSRVITANRALLQVAGRSAEEIIGRSCYEVCHGNDSPTSNCPKKEILGANETASAEVECERLGGTFLISCSPMFDDVGQIDRIIHIAWNITEHKQAQEAVQRLHIELSAAQSVQEALLPKTAPAVPGFDIACFNTPAEYTAGDFHQFFPMSDGRLGVAVADVIGHGLGPALVAAELGAYLRCLTQTSRTIEDLITRLNELLCQDLQTGDFVTLFFGLLAPNLRSFTYVAAGQLGFLVHADGESQVLDTTTFPLGIDENADMSSGPSISLEPGQIILLPTDGIYEAHSTDGDLFGKDRMINTVRANRDGRALGVVEGLKAAVLDHLAGDSPPDDLTAVVIKVAEI